LNDVEEGAGELLDVLEDIIVLVSEGDAELVLDCRAE
jgi:hypothetical protein